MYIKFKQQWHFKICRYQGYPKFSDRHIWASETQSGQDIHCLPFRLHILDILFYGIGYMLSMKQAILPSISKTTTHITMK